MRTLGDAVEEHARSRPDHPALLVENVTLTYGELAKAVKVTAGGLAGQGVSAGDTVALVLPNCVEFVVAWLALGRLGATAAPVNTTLATGGLASALELSGAQLAVVDERFLPVFADARPDRIRTVVVRGETGGADLVGVEVRDWSRLASPGTQERHDVRPGEASIVLFTSGSTGRSKACVLPHRFVTRQAEIFAEQMRLTSEDVLFCPFPLFHADAAIFTVGPAFVLGATAALVERFSVRRFWDQIRRYQATVFDFMGATLTMLHKQDPGPADADNPARLGWGVPLPAWAGQFEQRFGVELVEVYGLSDAGIVLYNRPGEPRRAGSCGRPIPAFEVRVLDHDGFELPPGEVGEICLRPNEPHIVLSEYLGMPDATVRAWRDLWFHTGDRGHRDADGYFYFAGRHHDVIRRRGENISAVEIEAVVADHPAVLEVAAYGVPSELTEDEVMVAITLRDGHRLVAAEFASYCGRRLPRHMVPRYLEFADALPRTPTEKVEKHVLKARGVGPRTIDLTRA